MSYGTSLVRPTTGHRMTAAIEGCFINVSGSPAEGRDARRIQVRSTLMSNYHKRRAQKKRQLDKMTGSRSPGKVPRRTSDHVAQSTVHPPTVSITPRRDLFQPRVFSNQDHTRTSRIIIGFFCGQVAKAMQDLSYVSFVHVTIGEVEGQMQSDNPLITCRDLLRQHYDPSTLHLSTLWEKIDGMQQDVYARVRCILLRST